IYELADSLSQQSVHIRYLNRFHDSKDMMGRKGWEGSRQFISVGKHKTWALIDLRPLRQQISDELLQGTQFEERKIANYDFIIIPPQDNLVQKHY
ncbi:MAG: hypothetical protein ACFCU6_07035, partial [Balneolaceae bacterium]